MKIEKKRVFKWTQRRAWERVFHSILASKINETVIAEARRINPRYLSDDNFAWLNTLVTTVTHQPLVDISTFLGLRLSNHYDFVVAFHGTRSDSAADFLTHGVKLSDKRSLQLRAIELFGNSDALQNAITATRHYGYERNSHGKIHLCMTKEAHTREHPDYMLDGSEYLAGIADRLGQRTKLRSVGKPLLVVCRIPASALDVEFWTNQSRSMIEDYFARLLRPLETRPISTSCVVLTQPIPAENILCVHEFSEVKRTFRWNDLKTNVPQESEETVLCPFKIWDGQASVESYGEPISTRLSPASNRRRSS